MAARWSLASSTVEARLGIGFSFNGYRIVMEGDTTLRPPRRLPYVGSGCSPVPRLRGKLYQSLCTPRHSQLATADEDGCRSSR